MQCRSHTATVWPSGRLGSNGTVRPCDMEAEVSRTLRAAAWAVQMSDAAVREAITRALLKAGADPSQALPGVAFSGDERAIDALLSAGADVDARDSHGATALIVAAKYGHTKSLQRLCAAGAGVEQVDERGRSALVWLACRGDI
jgi:Ankyrin repeats (many copies)